MAKPPEPHCGEMLDEIEMTLGELCRICDIHAEAVIRMVEEGLLEPQGQEPLDWRFSGPAVQRMQIALRLQRDLDVNVPGAALALDLLEELETLRARVQALEKDLLE